MHYFIGDVFDLIKASLGDILGLRDQFSEKPDGSFVSQGDLLVQSLVSDYLRQNLKDYQLLSEEQAPFDESTLDPMGRYVVLDPIDGTENFVSGLREWGVGISIYAHGEHQASGIFLPELNDRLVSGDAVRRFRSRVVGLSSSLSKADLAAQPDGFEYRVIGCAMYNTLAAVRGSFRRFENVKGVNAWDILPGLNLALEHGCQAFVDGQPYHGELLLPTKKYRIMITQGENNE